MGPVINPLYDSIAIENSAQMREAQRQVNEEMIRRDCLFDGKPLPHFLKPYFLSEKQTELLGDMSACLIGVLEKITKIYFERPELQSKFGLSPLAAELMEIHPGYSRNIVISRPDAFLDGEDLQFIEFNCDSPAGAVFTDLEEEIFLNAFPMTELGKQVDWVRFSRTEAVVDALLDCYMDFGGRREHPSIAIVDWRDVKTQGEFKLLQNYLNQEGYEAVIADPRDLVYKQGELYAGGVRIDLVYRRVIFNELMESIYEVQDFIRAYRDKKVCVVNPLRSRLAANKAMLSLLTNNAYDHFFTDKENEAKKKYIAWTRRLVDAEHFYGGRKKLVIDLVLNHQEDMVLKPADGYGGKNVFIGRETSKEEWRRLAEKALDAEEEWVVQEYVPIPEQTVPVIEGNAVKLVKKKVNINPYVFNGRYAGAIARLSDDSVINVSAGGGLVPAITYAEREET
ncbi:MAG: circularly permuted type 2 ATP-grasp protein [Candidatus Omnitrophica bacterium]|nr:circularly permuted type 2 ATP-grasp protein [Candidatus Omnitrophota bacterium]